MAILSNEDVAGLVRGIVAQQQISYSQIALTLNLSAMAVSRRMNGKTPWMPTELSALANLLEVSPAAFFGSQALLERVS